MRISSTGQLLFTFVCSFSAAYFFFLSIKWHELMSQWQKHEKTFLNPPYANKIHKRIILYFQFVAMIVIAFAVCDHFFYIVAVVEKTEDLLLYCEDSKQDFWKMLFVNERQAFFQIIPYAGWEPPFLLFYEICKQVQWAFSESFMIIAACTLALRVDQYNKRLKSYCGRHMNVNFWNEARNHYNVLANLVLHADIILSPMFLMYCFSNSYFICQKIFIQFEKGKLRWERYISLTS